MIEGTKQMSAVRRLELERDAALAAYGRIAPLLERAAARYHHVYLDGRVVVAPHDGWTLALQRAADDVRGLDVAGASERMTSRWLQDRGAA